ncbi:lipid asymmetry maintenance protein MlaB [Marinobacter sp.]|uniref:lipid asymmetry maintenance protein MlaB n=1 Tax=Marinobacter sp. TaxID=50741 RepID=UPI0034A23210
MTGASAHVELTGSTLALSGAISPLNVVGVRKEGEWLIASAPGDLVVDVSALGTAHSAVLSLLLCWQRCATSLGRPLVFSGVSDGLVALASLSNLDTQLPGFNDKTSG